MKRQCVVRTYPNGYTNTTKYLDEKLRNGWIVVMCNKLPDVILEYILEIDIKEEK